MSEAKNKSTGGNGVPNGEVITMGCVDNKEGRPTRAAFCLRGWEYYIEKGIMLLFPNASS